MVCKIDHHSLGLFSDKIIYWLFIHLFISSIYVCDLRLELGMIWPCVSKGPTRRGHFTCLFLEFLYKHHGKSIAEFSSSKICLYQQTGLQVFFVTARSQHNLNCRESINGLFINDDPLFWAGLDPLLPIDTHWHFWASPAPLDALLMFEITDILKII